MSSVAALGLENELIETLKAKQGSRDILRIFNEYDALPDIIGDIKKHHHELELVLLGARVPDPVQMVQRVHAIDKSISIIVLVDEHDAPHTKRAFQFAPFIGDQVQCVINSNLDIILNTVGTSIQTTRSRRSHSRVISQLNRNMNGVHSRTADTRNVSPHFDKLLDIAPVGIVLIDQSGNILAWNKSAQQLSGLSEREAILRQFQCIFSPESESVLLGMLAEAKSSNTPVTVEVFRQMPGKIRYFEITAGSLGQEHNNNLMLVMQEISDRHEAKLALLNAKRQAEASNEAKSHFLANMSHEIRTPIGAMLGFLDLLKQPGNSASDINDYMSTIDRNGHQLLRLIDDILELSKIEAGKVNIVMSQVSLMQQLADVQSTMNFRAAEKGLHFRINFKTAVPESIVSDPVRLRQVLYNLIGNAIKFTEKGSIELNVSYDLVNLHFAVTDTGIGISPEQRSKLFQPFTQADPTVTRKFGGTGLGLALSRKLVEVLGGSLDLVESSPGVGSTFGFSIPINRTGDVELVGVDRIRNNSEPEPESAEKANKFPLRNMRLLLVEDSADNQILVTRLLKAAGAEVDLATDGEAGIQKALAHYYDVVLMDVQMPICGGLEATRRLRQTGYSRPIIALTAHAMEEERQKSFVAGCTDHLTKPINRTQLIQTISRYK